MINKYLKPIFNSVDFSQELIMVSCSLGYDGNVNLLFADKVYDNLRIRRVKNIDPLGKRDWGYRTVKNFKIVPSHPQNYKLFILGNDNKIVELNNKKINYTHGLQIDNDKYCFICRTINTRYRNNVTITNTAGKIMHKFTIGMEVIDVQTNRNHELWVTYSDVGIFGGFFEDTPNIEASGLNCFDLFGNIVYKYKNELFIAEGRSLNVISENETMINIYASTIKSCNALGIITNKKVSKIIEWGEFTRYFAYWDNKALVERNRSTEAKSKFALLDIEKGTDMEIFEFCNEEGEKLNCINGQGDKLYFWEKNYLYSVSVKDLMPSC
jgi:hypothetical protein